MGLLSFLKRLRGTEQKPSKSPSKAPSADEVQRARIRARQRLIGAVVLLGIGVIGFPLVFETQPRPIPVDIPIDIPRKEATPPLATPPARSRPVAPASAPVLIEKAPDADREVTPPAAVLQASAPTRDVVREEPKQVEAKTEKAEKPEQVQKTEKADKAEKPEKPEKVEKDKADAGRYVVQVGAFSDAGTAREARQKVEKLGLRTYTQVVETDSGKRIRVRVGPFASRDEADRAAGKLKSAGLPSAILGL